MSNSSHSVEDRGHTPGPWIVECDNEQRDDGADEITANGIVIARVCGEDEIKARILKGRIEGPGCQAAADALDEVDANARLIAAAPRLLAELKDAVQNCPCSVRERNSGHRIGCNAPIWQAAIDRAEGRSDE
jgi:hypothetical protein